MEWNIKMWFLMKISWLFNIISTFGSLFYMKSTGFFSRINRRRKANTVSCLYEEYLLVFEY